MEVVKKTLQITDQSATFLAPPPPVRQKRFYADFGRKKKKKYYFSTLKDAEWFKTYVFYERKKTLVLKENTGKNVQVFNGYHCKNVTKYFCIFFTFPKALSPPSLTDIWIKCKFSSLCIKVYVFETRKAWNGWFCNKKNRYRYS